MLPRAMALLGKLGDGDSGLSSAGKNKPEVGGARRGGAGTRRRAGPPPEGAGPAELLEGGT